MKGLVVILLVMFLLGSCCQCLPDAMGSALASIFIMIVGLWIVRGILKSFWGGSR